MDKIEELLDNFKKTCRKIDEEIPISSPPKPDKAVKLYNIFKRTLPTAINKLVFQNIPEEDVNFLFRNILRVKRLNDDSLLYWDAVLTGSSDEWNVYSNEGIDTTDMNGGTNINTYRESTKEVDWKG